VIAPDRREERYQMQQQLCKSIHAGVILNAPAVENQVVFDENGTPEEELPLQETEPNNIIVQNKDEFLNGVDNLENPTSFKLVALKPMRAKIGIPTTETIGETTVNGSKKPLRILIDTGGSSTIILKKFINKSVLVKNSRTTTEWTTLGRKFYTKKQGTVTFKLPEFFLNKTIEFKVHVKETTAHASAADGMIIGRDLITELKLVIDFDIQCITWDGVDQPMKT
jgi:predicted aspartyl protease